MAKASSLEDKLELRKEARKIPTGDPRRILSRGCTRWGCVRYSSETSGHDPLQITPGIKGTLSLEDMRRVMSRSCYREL
jgi:hypothetical protein